MKKKEETKDTRTFLGRLIGWIMVILLCVLILMIVWNVYLQLDLRKAKGRVFILEMQGDRLLSMLRISYEVNAFYSKILGEEELGEPFKNWPENESDIRFNYNIPQYSEYPPGTYDQLMEKEAEMVASGGYR